MTQRVDLGSGRKTKGTDEKRERQKRRETGRKGQHQQGFSFVKQEVWGTKGQTEGLFQSVPLLSHCFHCHSSRRAVYRLGFVSRNRTVPENASGVFAFMSGLNAAVITEQGSLAVVGNEWMNEFGILIWKCSLLICKLFTRQTSSNLLVQATQVWWFAVRFFFFLSFWSVLIKQAIWLWPLGNQDVFFFYLICCRLTNPFINKTKAEIILSASTSAWK